MLIRKAAVAPLPARLENLLATYEKNLRFEVFFIRNKDTASLLEILPQQGDLIRAIEEILPTLDLPDATAAVLAKRLAEADALREANRMEVDRGVEELKNELQEMNAARVRIRQMRHISKTTYTQEEPAARLQDWA
jgi:hypothetical protein